MNTAKHLLLLLSLALVSTANAQEDNPFKSIGKKGEIITASNGKYIETFDYDSVQRIGTVLFNIKTRKIIRLLNSDKMHRKFSDNSSSSRWLSKDPMAEKYYSLSPYAFALNNPILFNDPDGRDVDPSKLKGDDNVNALKNVLSTKAGFKLIGQFMHKGQSISIKVGGKTTTFTFNKEGARAKDNLVLVSTPNSQMNPESQGAAGAPREGVTREFERDSYKKEIGENKDYDIKKGATYLVNIDQDRNEEESTNTLTHELSVHVDPNAQRVQNAENKVVDGSLRPGTPEYLKQLQNIQTSAATDHRNLGRGLNTIYQNISAQLDQLKSTNQYTELYKQDVNANK